MMFWVGRSAAMQGDESNARAWLGRAASLAASEPVGCAATDLMRGLDQGDE
jgi:hypothetical protein